MPRRPTDRRAAMPLSVVAALVIAVAADARAEKPWPQFKELYGSEIDAVSQTLMGLFGDEMARVDKTESTADDALLARRLAVMAERSADRKPLLALAAQHAFVYGVRDPNGFEAADRGLTLLIEHLPASTHAAWEGRRLQLRLRRLELTEQPKQGPIVLELVRDLDAWGKRQGDAGQWDEAAKTWAEARRLAQQYKHPDAQAIDARYNDALKRVVAIAQAQARAKAEAEQMARQKAELDRRRQAEDRRLRLKQALVDRDDPRAALDIARELDDAELAARLAMAAEPVDELEPDDAAALGRWYLDMATEAGADARTRMMIRAWRYFDRFLDQHTQRDAERTQVAFTLDALTKDLDDMGVAAADLARLDRPRRVMLETHVNAIGMRLVRAPRGVFSMGSPEAEAGRRSVELPHNVQLTRDYHIGVTEVTQGQWRRVMGNNPSKAVGDDLPVDSVTWADAREFCRKLSATEGRTYRLPTEAEWEYACRAGTSGRFADNSFYPDAVAWYTRNADGKPHPVATRAPNAWGIYDMHGNAAEWCEDYADIYTAERAVDPQGPATGEDRVIRGGSWQSEPEALRSAARLKAEPARRSPAVGFRVVMIEAPLEPDTPDAPKPEPEPKPEPTPVAEAETPAGEPPAEPNRRPGFFGIPTDR